MVPEKKTQSQRPQNSTKKYLSKQPNLSIKKLQKPFPALFISYKNSRISSITVTCVSNSPTSQTAVETNTPPRSFAKTVLNLLLLLILSMKLIK